MSAIISLISIVGIACLLLGIVMLFNLISDAFKKSARWGFICLVFPPGTYYYCRENWTEVSKAALPMAICLTVGVVISILDLFF